ncbi:MAG: FecR domain-containing protein [Polyangiaceae bacterium]|nr:FecR domain-containing protein [Polyangiaceae bacterium]
MTFDSSSRASDLPHPLREVLREPVDDAAVARMWHGIEGQQGRRSAPARGAWVVVAAAAAVLLVVLVAVRLRGPAPPAALLTAEGTAFVRLDTTGQGLREQRFADGSRLVAASDTRVEGLAFTGQEVALLLERGRVEVSVVPGGPRRWSVEAKLARVEVVGTRFSVTRSEARVSVAVAEGTVLVRSPLLPDGVARLDAGQGVELALPPRAPAERPPPASTAVAPTGTEPAPPIPPPPPSGAPPSSSASGSPAGVEALLRRADAARLAGDLALAELLLERVVRDSPEDGRASLAAFTLGVIRMDRGDLPRAIAALRRALALGAPATLEQDCYLRLVEAELRSSERARALATSEEYRRRFPNGRHRRAIAALLEQRGEAPSP